jgi:hypothetical protein
MFLCFLLFVGTFTSFFKDKMSKRSHNSRNQGFSYYFSVLRIRIRRIHMSLGLLDLDPDPLVRDVDPDMDPDPSITKQK